MPVNVWAGKTRWGTVETAEEEQDVRFTVQGERIPAVWRVWGIRKGKQPLLIGIPEPEGDCMVLRRRLSKTFLQRCGYWPALPEQYVAGEVFEPVENERETQRLTCRFDPRKEFPFAYAFAVCTVKDGVAELLVDKKTGRPIPLERPADTVP
jgi:hypothetical protein